MDSSPALEIGTNSVVSSGLLVEEKCFTWKIQDFDLVRCSDKLLDSQEFCFKAGKSIGLASTWKFSLRHETEGVGIFFGLVDPPKNVDEVNLSFTLKIKKTTAEGDVMFRNCDFGLRGIKVGKELGYSKFLKKNLPVEQLPLVDGALCIEAVFKLYGFKPAKLDLATKVQHFQWKSLEKLGQDLAKPGALFGSNADSATTITCKENVVFPVNRGVLSARSSVFERMFQTDMMESQTGKVEIDDISGQTVKVLLHYITCGMLHEDWKTAEVIEELPLAAQKYDLQLLFEFLDEVLGEFCTKKNAARLLVLAKRLDMKKAERELFTFFKNNAESLEDLALDGE